MTIGTALLLATLAAGTGALAPHLAREPAGDQRAAMPLGFAHPVAPPAPDLSALAEMAPAPGRWEAEDAPAYFSSRRRPPDPIRDGSPMP